MLPECNQAGRSVSHKPGSNLWCPSGTGGRSSVVVFGGVGHRSVCSRRYRYSLCVNVAIDINESDIFFIVIVIVLGVNCPLPRMPVRL